MARVEISEAVFGRSPGTTRVFIPTSSTVTVYNRGTVVRATWWTAATGGSSSTADIAVGSTGRIEAYLPTGSYDLYVQSPDFDPYTQEYEAVSATPMTVDAAIAALSPTTFWKLDERTGNFADSGSGGITATYVSGTRSRKAYRGSLGVNLSVETAVATFGDNYRFLNRAPFTILCLHNPTTFATAARRMVTKSDNAPTLGWQLLYQTDGTVAIWRVGGTLTASDLSATVNEWNLCAGIYDGTLVGTYINGVHKLSTTDTANVTADTNVGRINGITGETPTPRGAFGTFDCVAIWTRALTQAELDTIWAAM